MRAPRYEQRCSSSCLDRNGKPRDGDRWIHIHGWTRWVCQPCERRFAEAAGIKTPHYVSLVVAPGYVQPSLGLTPETHMSASAKPRRT